MEFGIEKCAIIIMNRRQWHRRERIELPNQDKMKTFGKTETYKYFRIFETDAIKHAKMGKKRKKKNTSGERENYSKSNYIA